MKHFTRRPRLVRWTLFVALAPLMFGVIVAATHVRPVVLSVAFSPDGLLLAISSEALLDPQSAAFLTVWDVKAGRRRFLIRPTAAAYASISSAIFG